MPRPVRPPPAPGASEHRAYKVQPPRPPNAWILYRSFRFALIRQTSERLSQAVVSKMISDMWKNETEDVRRQFERMAEARKAEHQQLYPGYRFSPQRREDKMRAKEDRRQGRRTKKSKACDATPPDEDVDADATADIPPPPPAIYMPHPYFVPGYQPNTPSPHHYLPETYYSPGGPSPPISAAPSPVPCESSESPEVQPYPEETVASSSSGPSARPSPGSELEASSSSSQLSPNPLHLSSLPNSLQPSSNPYATQPLQSPPPNELPLSSPQVQFLSAENTVVPAAPVWNNVPTQLSSLTSHNSEEVVRFDVPINQMQNFSQLPQSLHRSPSSRVPSMTDENGAFLTAHPKGELEVAMGSQASTIDYNEELFTDFDFADFQKEMASFVESSASSAATASSVQDDLQALFHTPDNTEIQAYSTTSQRQPSVFTQDMMHFFNFEAAEAIGEDTSSAVPPPSLPTTVAPQQVRLQSAQNTVAMPIFTQMTNTPTVASGTSYVPPAGAINASTRRVAGSWKPPFAIPPLQVDEPWSLSIN